MVRAIIHTLKRMAVFCCFVPTLLASAPVSVDFQDVKIGVATNPDGPTGVTVLYFPKGATAAIDIRGGSVGTFFTSEKMQQGEAKIDAIALTGGGILGLEAVSGVVAALWNNQPTQPEFAKIPLVSGAVIYDFKPRKNKYYPDKALGQLAFQQAKMGEWPTGRVGAGASASVGKILGDYTLAGQGVAFGQIGDTKIAVLTVVNALGVILNDQGEIMYGAPEGMTKADFIKAMEKNVVSELSAQNTTLTVVITNQKLNPRHLKQLGRQVHHALSQVIYPYATILDGDVLYMVSTETSTSTLYRPGAEIETDVYPPLMSLGVLAGELAKQAVWQAVQPR